MKKSLLTLSCVAVLAAFTACSEESEEILGSSVAQKSSKVTFSVENLFDGQTRTILYENGVSAWTAGDIIGVLPCTNAEGGAPAGKAQVDFVLSDGSINSDGSCVFDGGSWALREGWSYIAYYPFNADHSYDVYNYGRIYFDYRTQPTQNGDNTIGHLAGVDYLVSKAVTVEGGNINFVMEHVSALLPLKLVFPADVEVMNVKLADPSIVAYYRVKNGKFVADGNGWNDGISMPVTNGATTNGVFTAHMFLGPQTLYSGGEVSVLTNKGIYYTSMPSDVTLYSGYNEAVTLEFAGEPEEVPTVKPGETLELPQSEGIFVAEIEEDGIYQMETINSTTYNFVSQFEYITNSYRKVPAGKYTVKYSNYGFGTFRISEPMLSVKEGTQDVQEYSYYTFKPSESGYYSISGGYFSNVDTNYGLAKLSANEIYAIRTYGNTSLTIALAKVTPVSLGETVTVTSTDHEYLEFTPAVTGWYKLNSDNGYGYFYDAEDNAGGLYYLSAGKTVMIRAWAHSDSGATFTIQEADAPMYVSAGVKLTQPGVYVYMLSKAKHWYKMSCQDIGYGNGGRDLCFLRDYVYTNSSSSRLVIEIQDIYSADAYYIVEESDGPSVNVEVNELFTLEPNSEVLVAVNIPEAGTYTIRPDDVKVDGGFCIIDEYGNTSSASRFDKSAYFDRPGVYYFYYMNYTDYPAYVTVTAE